MRTVIIEQVELCEHYKIEKRFNNFRKNIQKFNGTRCTYNTRKLGNGKKFEVIYNNKVIQEITLLADRYCWELSRTSF